MTEVTITSNARAKRGNGAAHLISQISLLGAQHATAISEIEINPVLVHPVGQGVTIVDALVVGEKRSCRPGPYAQLRIRSRDP